MKRSNGQKKQQRHAWMLAIAMIIAIVAALTAMDARAEFQGNLDYVHMSDPSTHSEYVLDGIGPSVTWFSDNRRFSISAGAYKQMRQGQRSAWQEKADCGTTRVLIKASWSLF